MKKNILFTIIALFIALFSAKGVYAIEINDGLYVNNRGIEMTENEILNLNSLGFSDYDINNMPYDIFYENKDLVGNVISTVTKYYRVETVEGNDNLVMNLMDVGAYRVRAFEITKEEYDSSSDFVMPLATGVVNTEYKEMTTSIVAVNGRYRYRNSVRWKQLPLWQTVDIISVGFDDKVYGVSSTKRLYAYYTFDNGCGINMTTDGVWQLNSESYGVTFDWPEKDNVTATNEGFYVDMYFEVDKNITDLITVLNAYGNYRHGRGNFHSTGIAPSVSFSINGIGISASYASYFDSISTAQATYSGITW